MFVRFFGLIEEILVSYHSPGLALIYFAKVALNQQKRTNKVTVKPTTYWQRHL